MPVSHKSRAYTHIRQKMLAGRLAAGARLSEVALAKEIGISRTPVREAMTQLEVEGLIEQVPRLGSFVRKIERYELQELYEIRELLEGYAATRAADRIMPEQLDELRQLCDHTYSIVRRFRDAGGASLDAAAAEQWAMIDVAFHMLILQASGSRRVSKIVSDFRIMTTIHGRSRRNPGRTPLFVMARTWAEHLRIVRALSRRDGRLAQRLVEAHIRIAKNDALANLDQEPLVDAEGATDWSASVREIIGRMERFGPHESK